MIKKVFNGLLFGIALMCVALLILALGGCAKKAIPVMSKQEALTARLKQAIEAQRLEVEEANRKLLEQKEREEREARELAEKKAIREAMVMYVENTSDAEITTHTVGTWSEDKSCLWNISKRPEIYNDPWKWKKIYNANRDKISDPDLIYPGQILNIP